MENEESAISESSSDDDDVSEDEQDTRTKRDTEQCGVDTENHAFYDTPPPPSSSSEVNYIDLRPKVGNTVPEGKMQLYSKTNYYLAIDADGTVKGSPNENDEHTYLEVEPAGFTGHVKIKGVETNMYVAMNEKGMLYGESDPSEEATVFIGSIWKTHNTYVSRKYGHLGWHIGIKKSGKIKRGPKTAYGQKAVRFSARTSKFD